MSAYTDRVLDELRDKYHDQPEFLQAVDEVLGSLGEYLTEHPECEEGKVLERLVEPDNIVEFDVEWQTDSGETMVNKGCRVQFNNILGPYKGGLRFHPSVNLSILKFLGFEQVFKNALTGLPLGGGKGGSDFNPKGKSDEEVKRFATAFMKGLHGHIGADIDVPAGDIGVGAREIKYMLDEYLQHCDGEQCKGAITGKAIIDGGSEIRTEATGYGLVYLVREALAAASDAISGKHVLISGSGNVAQYAAEKCIGLGAKVLTMSDSSGYIVDDEGIDSNKLAFIKELKNVKRGRIKEYTTTYKSAEYHEGSVWAHTWKPGFQVDIALPCATQNEIDEDSAKSLAGAGIRLVAEGANMPSTKEAVDLFQGAGVTFLPAKAANAGGVAVSGLEMEQNKLGEQWEREVVDQKLQDIMRHIHSECVEHGTSGGKVDYVIGANIAGFKRVASAIIDLN